MKRRSLFFLLVFAGLFLLFLLSPLFCPDPDVIDLSQRLLPPGPGHLFGTDTMGRDLLSRVLAGGRLSYLIGLLTTAITAVISLFLGLAASADRRLDTAILRLCDSFKALPTSLLAILLMMRFGGGVASMVAALVVVNIPQSVRLVRARALAVESEDFILVKKSLGLGKWEIVFGTVSLHVLDILAVQCAFIFSSSIMAEAALSFIGAGMGPEAASWGTILDEGRDVIYQAWWMIVFPSAFIFLSVLSLNMIASSLRRD